MTLIRFFRTRPTADGTRVPASGTLRFTPTRERVVVGDPDEVILPISFSVQVPKDTGRADVDLAPTGTGWVWEVYSHSFGVTAEYAYVIVPEPVSDPDAPGEFLPVDEPDLVRVDKDTLDPAAVPDPLWWAELEAAKATAADVELARVDAAGSATSAAQSANIAGTARAGAETARTESVNAKNIAVEASATAKTITGQAVEQAILPNGAARSALTAAIADSLGGADAVQPFLSVIENGVRDANLLLIADSTSNEQSEWAYLFFADLATRYPSHAFEYRLWNDTNQSYDPAVTIGAGAHKVTLWNASFPGATTQSWQEQRITPAIYNVPADVVLISLGHNEASGSNYAWAWRSRYLSLTESIKARKPNSAMVLIGQNPATANTWQAQRIEVYKEIASRQGYGFIDVHAEFIRVGGNLTIDGIHPTPAGSRLWADVMLSAFTRTRHAPRFQETSMLANHSIESVMPNGFFTEWTGGSPTGWLTSRATSSKDTTTMETGDSAWKLDVTGDAAVTYLNLDASKVAGKRYSLAVRMKVAPGSTVNTTGRIGTYDNVNNSTLQPVGSGITDGYRWMLHEGSFAPGATSARIYIYLGNIGSSITIDRIILTQGPDPTDAVQLTASSSGGTGGVVEIPWTTPAGLTLVTGATADTLLLKRVGPMVFLRVTNLVLPTGFTSGALGNVPAGYMSNSGPTGAVSVGWSQMFATGNNNPRYLQYMAISGGGLRWTGSLDINTGTYGAKPARIDGVLQWYTDDPMPV